MTSLKSNRILSWITALLLVILVNQVAWRYRIFWDTTEEKRYTLDPATQKLLLGLEEPVNIEVYLAGELPANFKRFQQSTRQLLEQFSLYGGNRIQFTFTDPALATSTKARNTYFNSLVEKGLQPSNISYTNNGEKTEKLIFPGAVVSYRGEEVAVNLLKGNRAAPIDEIINQSIEGLEYELAATIRKMQVNNLPKVGFVLGHNEPDSSMLAGFTNAILSRYELFKINLPNRKALLTGYDVIIIGKPTERFSEYEKYLLDQFVMNGGKLILFLDALAVNMQEAGGEGTIALPYDTDLDDLLFRYGVRLNRDYVADINCGDVPIVSGNVAGQPRIELLPWPYFPVITHYGKHPLVRNLDATLFRGVSTLDTVKAEGIIKTPLFYTSPYTRVFSPPVRVSYNDLREKLKPESFTSGEQVLGYLLEGNFTSLFKNRFPPAGIERSEMKEIGAPTKIIIISDGDFIRNEFNPENQSPLPMGVDPYNKTTYANENFLMNALDYLTDDSGLLAARNREIAIRPLNKVKVLNERTYWKIVNMAIPIALLVVFGFLKFYLRKHKYGR